MTSFDNENPVSSAAAAPAQEAESPNKPEENRSRRSSRGRTPHAVCAARPAPVEQVKSEDAHQAAEAHAQTAAADAEAAAAAEEAAGAEEMSKLIEQYSEPQEAASQNEIIEVKVVAYTEHGVVVDLGGKTEGLIPGGGIPGTDIPRPDPNATIEVQRTGEHKDGFVILSYQKVLRRRTWEKNRCAVQSQGNHHAQRWWTASRADWLWMLAVRAFLPGSQYDLRPTANLDGLMRHEVEVRITKLNRRRGNVVVSRRALLEEELHAKRAELMEKLKRRAGGSRHGEERDRLRRLRGHRRHWMGCCT